MYDLIKFNNVSKSYGVSLVIENINFTIKNATITALIGPNGAGKTTVARLLLGIEKPSTGHITREVNINFSYIPQILNLNYNLPITALEFLNYISPNWQNGMKEIIEFSNIQLIKYQQINTLSGGQLQKILIAANLLKDSNFIILDEPTKGLDVIAQQQFYSLLKKVKSTNKVAIFTISHDLHTVISSADQILCINKHICCSSQSSQSSNLTVFNPNLSIYTHNHDHFHN